MNNSLYPNLLSLFGAYLHQDWDLEFGTPDRAILAFKENAGPERIAATCEELEALIRTVDGLPDPDRFLLQDLLCYYSPKAAHRSVSAWLQHVKGILRKRCQDKRCQDPFS